MQVQREPGRFGHVQLRQVDRGRVETWGVVSDSNNSCFMSNCPWHREWRTVSCCPANALASSPWTDGTERALLGTAPCVSTLHLPDITAHDQISLPSPSIFAYCKRSNTGGGNGLGMRLQQWFNIWHKLSISGSYKWHQKCDCKDWSPWEHVTPAHAMVPTVSKKSFPKIGGESVTIPMYIWQSYWDHQLFVVGFCFISWPQGSVEGSMKLPCPGPKIMG